AEFTKRAEDLLSYVARVEESNARKLAAPPPPLMAGMAAVAPPENSADEGGTPSLRPTVRRDEPRETHEATRADLEMILQDAGGKLVEMVCGEKPAMVLEMEQGRKRFLVLDPTRIFITGRPPGETSLACGVQQDPQRVRLQFSIAPEGSQADGVVKAVHFGQ
ncbi:MAG: hypothetical protein ABI995_15650, partial [Acidobacteriota bacterium]